MTLELTAKCNFRCPYCYCVWHERPELAKPELDAAAPSETLAASHCVARPFYGILSA